MRIGVNTGEALVVVGADAARGEGMASGDVVNTAARLQAAAPVDGILVGETTYCATDRAIRYTEAEPIVAKGKASRWLRGEHSRHGRRSASTSCSGPPPASSAAARSSA